MLVQSVRYHLLSNNDKRAKDSFFSHKLQPAYLTLLMKAAHANLAHAADSRVATNLILHVIGHSCLEEGGVCNRAMRRRAHAGELYPECIASASTFSLLLPPLAPTSWYVMQSFLVANVGSTEPLLVRAVSVGPSLLCMLLPRHDCSRRSS